MIVAACQPVSSAPAIERSVAGLDVIPVEIRSSSGVHRFRAEVAATREEQSRGLMYRQQLPDNAGMIFPYDPPEFASFWMENTYLPLDLIFVSPDGTIERIAANAVPFSRELITSTGPVKAVLEINGGLAANLGIRPGDRVTWRH